MFYVMSGKGEIEINGVKNTLSKGSLVVFQSGTEYRWQVGDMQICIINFDYNNEFGEHFPRCSPIPSNIFNKSNYIPFCEFTDAVCLNSPLVLREAYSIGEKIKELAVENHFKDDFNKEFNSTFFKTVIINIVRKANENTNTQTKNDIFIVKKVIEYIEEHFNEGIKNEDIAKYICFDASYINRIFKRYTKMTMHAFLLEQRLNCAMEKLKNEKSTIGEIAMASGFSDIPHFTKIFKKYVGKTPSEYRKNIDL